MLIFIMKLFKVDGVLFKKTEKMNKLPRGRAIEVLSGIKYFMKNQPFFKLFRLLP